MSKYTKLRDVGVPIGVHYVLLPDNFQFVTSVIQQCIDLHVEKLTFQTCIPREDGESIVNSTNYDAVTIADQLKAIEDLSKRYASVLRLKTLNLYDKFYYVLEPDRTIYLEKSSVKEDIICCSL